MNHLGNLQCSLVITVQRRSGRTTHRHHSPDGLLEVVAAEKPLALLRGLEGSRLGPVGLGQIGIPQRSVH